MVAKVIERPAYTLPVQGAESAFVQQLLQTTQQHGYAINQLIGLLEAGTFTPTLTFATPGDLSVVYVAQAGFYWRLGPLVFIEITVTATPTFTTASGLAKLTGLPYPADGSGAVVLGGVQFGAAGITYPAGRTDVFAYINAGEYTVQFQASGSAVDQSGVEATNFTSGATTGAIRVQGFYPTDAVEGF